MASKLTRYRCAWDRQHGEPQEDFRKFSIWLRQEERELPLADLDVAQRWNWTERADQFDRAHTIEALTPDEQRVLFGLAAPKVMLHAMQRLAEQLEKPGAQITAKDVQILQEIDRTAQGLTSGQATIDITQLSREDRDAYLASKELERRLLKEGDG